MDLHDFIEDITILIDGAPEVTLLTVTLLHRYARSMILMSARPDVSRRAGELSCLSNFISKAVVIFLVRDTAWAIGGNMTRFTVGAAKRTFLYTAEIKSGNIVTIAAALST